MTRKAERPPVYCLDCPRQLGRTAAKAGSLRCRSCASRHPESRARRAAAMRAAHERNPEWRERLRDPAKMAKTRTPEAKAKRAAKRGVWAAKVTEARMGWCPPEYRPLYRKLRKRQLPSPDYGTSRAMVDGRLRFVGKVLGSAKAREMIEAHLGGPLRPVRATAWLTIRGRVEVGGRQVRLAPLTMGVLLALLGQRPEPYLSTEAIIERVWPDPDLEPDYAVSIVRSCVAKLRRAGIRVVRDRSGRGCRGYRIPPEARSDWQAPLARTRNGSRLPASPPESQR